MSRSRSRSGNERLRELSQLYYINREIKLYYERIAQIEARAEPGAVKLSALPRAHRKSDLVGDTAAEAADAKSHYAALLIRREAEKKRLYKVIEELEDSRLRQIYTLRFVEGLGWWQVAHKIGGGNTADSCRKSVMRHIRAQKKEPGG